MKRSTLRAAEGLTLHLGPDRWRLAWREPDWLGPLSLRVRDGGGWIEMGSDLGSAGLRRAAGADLLGRFVSLTLPPIPANLPLQHSVRVYQDRPLFVFRTEARAALQGLASGTFAEPTVAWPVFSPALRKAGGAPRELSCFGHQTAEFALPIFGDQHATGFRLAPHRPAAALPLLWIAGDGRTLLLAPLDHFHEQIIALPREEDPAAGSVRCGWHGDLDEVPAGFATEIAVWGAASPRQAILQWGEWLRLRYHSVRRSAYADRGLAQVSYWTDNGAYYYYRTEPGMDYTETLGRVVDSLEASGVPVGAVQLDSWFYPHEELRPVGERGADLVPPTGAMLWEPREDLFPRGFGPLCKRLAFRPLILHSRHFSSRSRYFEIEPAWTDGAFAHPRSAAFFSRLLSQAASWGAVTYEQDWLVESFLNVRGLREGVGRTRAWQEALDRAAAAHGLTLQWCMAAPADFLQTLTLPRVTSIRTCGDYRYLFDNGLLWNWFLCTNLLARALGLFPFKDVFLTQTNDHGTASEPYAEVEALLAALSAGPVGIGDRLGETRQDIVLRTCRADGILIKPDLPIAAIDRCLRRNSFLEPELLVGETVSQHPAGRWMYVTSLNAFFGRTPLCGSVALPELGYGLPAAPVISWNWRTRQWQRLGPEDGWSLQLDFQDWDYRILCPLLPGEITVFGDTSKYATAGTKRLANIRQEGNTLSFTVEGAENEEVAIHGWSASRPRQVRLWTPEGWRDLPFTENENPSWTWQDTGPWRVQLRIPTRGWAHVHIALGG